MSDKKICGGCVRFKENMSKHNKPCKYNCACRHREDLEVYEFAEACEIYWDCEKYEKNRARAEKEEEERRQKLFEETSKLPPMRLQYTESYDYVTDSIITNGELVCPYCKEMPYSTERCVFCGMKFIQDDENLKAYKDLNSGRKEEVMKCISCGKETMVIVKYKRNGEWRTGHGHCDSCGSTFIV